MAATCGNRYSISGAGDLQELERVDTVTSILKRKHSLLLTLKDCDLNEPSLC